jgi:hypothetical protein
MANTIAQSFRSRLENFGLLAHAHQTSRFFGEFRWSFDVGSTSIVEDPEKETPNKLVEEFTSSVGLPAAAFCGEINMMWLGAHNGSDY